MVVGSQGISFKIMRSEKPKNMRFQGPLLSASALSLVLLPFQ